jgi:hypothetical protein
MQDLFTCMHAHRIQSGVAIANAKSMYARARDKSIQIEVAHSWLKITRVYAYSLQLSESTEHV